MYMNGNLINIKVKEIMVTMAILGIMLNSIIVNAETQWSEWVDNLPSGIDNQYEKQERTVYRYRDKSHTTSTSSTLSGWTKEKDPTVSYSSWSAWQDSAVTKTSTREVQTQQVGAGTYTYYDNPAKLYYPNDNIPIPTRTLRNYTAGDDVKWVQAFFKHYVGITDFQIDGKYGSGTAAQVNIWQGKFGLYQDGVFGTDTKNKFLQVWRENTKVENKKTQYRYRTKTTTYYYYKWSSWSSWSTTKPSSNSDREIESKKQYRYRLIEKTIQDATVTGINTTYTYTGSTITPVPTVKYGNTTLASGTDYTVSYSNNVNEGTATVTITGKGNYTGTINKTFVIEKPVEENTGTSEESDNGNKTGTSEADTKKDNTSEEPAKPVQQDTTGNTTNIEDKRPDSNTTVVPATTESTRVIEKTTAGVVTIISDGDEENDSQETYNESVNSKNKSYAKKGEVLEGKTGKYKITSIKKNEVTYTAPNSTSVKNVTIPETVDYKNKTYKVTSIANGAFKNNNVKPQIISGDLSRLFKAEIPVTVCGQ